MFKTSSPKPQDQFHPHFTGMFLRWSSFKIVQILQFHRELWSLRHQKGGKMSKFLRSSLKLLVGFQYNLVEMFLG